MRRKMKKVVLAFGLASGVGVVNPALPTTGLVQQADARETRTYRDPGRNACDGRVQPYSILVSAEAPARLERQEITFFNDFGEKHFGRIDRHVYADDALVKNGQPGPEVSRVVDNRGKYNPFWDSLNNRSDPALLRAHARFLELSAGKGMSVQTRTMRKALLALVSARLTSGEGLDSHELAYFPGPTAVAIIKRLAVAAQVPLAKVRINDHVTYHSPLPLAAYEATAAKQQYMPSYEPLVPRYTPAGGVERDRLNREVARMSAFFDTNHHATLADYSKFVDDWERRPMADPAFWGAMEAMLRRADVAELAGPAGVQGGGAVGRPTPVQRSPGVAASPSTPTELPTPKTSLRTGRTAWEMLSDPRFQDHVDAKSRGYRGGFKNDIDK